MRRGLVLFFASLVVGTLPSILGTLAVSIGATPDLGLFGRLEIVAVAGGFAFLSVRFGRARLRSASLIGYGVASGLLVWLYLRAAFPSLCPINCYDPGLGFIAGLIGFPLYGALFTALSLGIRDLSERLNWRPNRRSRRAN